METKTSHLVVRYRRWLVAPWWLHLLCTLVALAAQQGAQAWLNQWYAASKFPVPYYVGQLSFSAARIQGWYADMIATGTLDIYERTQLVDFAFIAATAATHFFVLSMVAKGLRGRWRRVATAMVAVGLAAPAFDIAENLVSFIMLADPTAIAQPVAVAYSTMAAAKFVCFILVYLWAPMGAVAGLARALRSYLSSRDIRRSASSLPPV